MQNIKINLPKEFLKEEIKCGYRISCDMKKVWAIEIDILCELKRICEKYNIEYFASGGTMLGAIRHKGMIPWDDDIDIGMRRKHYDEFKKIIEKELRYPYFFQDEFSDPGSLTGHGRILNLTTTAINKYHLNKASQGECRFKQCIFVDIFVFDNVPNDERERCDFINNVFEMGRGVWNESKKYNRGMTISSNYIPARYTDYEKLMAKYKDIPGIWAYAFAAGRKGLERFAYLNSEFESIIKMDFEFIKIPVIEDYNNKLTRSYGNWREYVMGASDHGGIGDIFFDTEHPCEYYLDNPTRMKEIKQKFGIND